MLWCQANNKLEKLMKLGKFTMNDHDFKSGALVLAISQNRKTCAVWGNYQIWMQIGCFTSTRAPLMNMIITS